MISDELEKTLQRTQKYAKSPPTFVLPIPPSVHRNNSKKIYSKLTTNQESALITITNPKKY